MGLYSVCSLDRPLWRLWQGMFCSPSGLPQPINDIVG
jgi:hypothetical protein